MKIRIGQDERENVYYEFVLTEPTKVVGPLLRPDKTESVNLEGGARGEP